MFPRVTRERTRGRRRGWAAGLSLAFHALVLLVLGWSAAPRPGAPARPPPPDMIVELAPSALQPARPTAAPAARTPLARERRPERAAPPPAPTPRSAPRTQPPVTAPASAPREPAASVPSPRVHPGPLPAEEANGDVRGVLRATVGCEHRDAVGLTAAERERCNETAGAVARAAPSFGPLPSDKLIGFSAAAAAAERRRAGREGPLANPVQACQGQGSNLGLGCLPAEASHHIAIP